MGIRLQQKLTTLSGFEQTKRINGKRKVLRNVRLILLVISYLFFIDLQSFALLRWRILLTMMD